MDKYKILIVDDDEDIRNALKELLEKENYIVVGAPSGKIAIELLNDTFDLIILDVMMPEKDGIETCVSIRERYAVPILFLTAKSTEYDKYIGLSVGADDYMAKPFSKMEILAKISALLRRYYVYQGKNMEPSRDYIFVKDLTIDTIKSRIFKGQQEIILTNTEYRILLLLAQNPNKIFTLANLYESIWGEVYDYSVNATIVVHIKNLRRKLGDTSQAPMYIKTIWGRGYCVER